MTDSTESANTINGLVDYSCEKFSERPLASFAFQEPFTYSEFKERFTHLARRLADIGVVKGDRIAIHAENSPQWIIAYLGAVRLGAIVTPILPDFTESDVLHILPDAKIKILFTTEKQIEKISELSGYTLEKIIMLDDYQGRGSVQQTQTLADFLGGDVVSEDERDEFPEVLPDDLASIIYTSGTSGHSKAVMLRHVNLCSNVNSARALVDIYPDWTFLSVLPISHTYEFTVGFLLPVRQGARVVYCDRRPTPMILEKICEVEKPSVMCVVPMIMEKIYKKRVLPKISNSKVLQFLLGVPYLRRKVLAKISGKLISFFGGKLELMAIGGAALNVEVEKFLHESGFPYIIGYGLTETSPIISGGPNGDPTIAVGSCGHPVPDVDVKIVKPNPETGIGEIHARGPNVMRGYYNNDKATAETIDDDGWLATGDLGCFDDLNNLVITGRSKSVIVMSNGENIYPETIEDKVNSSIHVSESLVTESNDRLVLNIFPDYEYIDLETAGKSEAEKLEHIKIILKDIQVSVNKKLPPYSQIHEVFERQEPFIKTATHKIKRYLYTGGA